MIHAAKPVLTRLLSFLSAKFVCICLHVLRTNPSKPAISLPSRLSFVCKICLHVLSAMYLQEICIGETWGIWAKKGLLHEHTLVQQPFPSNEMRFYLRLAIPNGFQYVSLWPPTLQHASKATCPIHRVLPEALCTSPCAPHSAGKAGGYA